MTAVKHELLCTETTLPSFLVECHGVIHQLPPACSGMNVNLDNTRIRGHQETFQAIVTRRFISLDYDRHGQFGSGRLNRCDQVQIMFELLQRGHKNMQPPFPGFDTECCMGDLGQVLFATAISHRLFMDFRVFSDRHFKLAVSFRHFTVVILKDRQGAKLIMLGTCLPFLRCLPRQRIERQA